MTSSQGPLIPTPSPADGSFSRALRFELADEENRALLGSYAISMTLGVAFLLLLQFGPRPVIVEAPAKPGPFKVRYIDPPSEPTVIVTREVQSARSRVARVAADIGSVFSRGAGSGAPSITGDPQGLLRVVDMKGAAAARSGDDKVVLGYGEGGAGSVIPGRGGVSAGAGGSSGIGGVSGATSVGRSAVVVSGPPVIPVAALGAGGRDVASVGTFVRGHEAELRFCYQDRGLALDPGLGGSIAVAVTVAASGAVMDASVARRSWSGPAAAAAEACILRAVRGWRLPAAEGGTGTYTLPFSFTR